MHLRGGGWRTIIRVLYRGFCHTKILNFTAPSYRFHFTIYWLTLISHVHLVIYRFQWKQYTKILTLWISIQNTDSEHQNTTFFSDIQNTIFGGTGPYYNRPRSEGDNALGSIRLPVHPFVCALTVKPLPVCLCFCNCANAVDGLLVLLSKKIENSLDMRRCWLLQGNKKNFVNMQSKDTLFYPRNPDLSLVTSRSNE